MSDYVTPRTLKSPGTRDIVNDCGGGFVKPESEDIAKKIKNRSFQPARTMDISVASSTIETTATLRDTGGDVTYDSVSVSNNKQPPTPHPRSVASEGMHMSFH